MAIRYAAKGAMKVQVSIATCLQEVTEITMTPCMHTLVLLITYDGKRG